MTSLLPDTFWSETATPAEDYPVLSSDIEVDVVIVGAGYTGLRAALVLAEAGTNVAVLDAGDVGWGASGRTGGQVNPMLPFNSPAQIRKRVGNRYFDRITEVSLGSADELFALIRHYGIDCQARQNGWLRVNHNRRAHTASLANADTWNQFGAEMLPVDSEQIQSFTGTDVYQTGILVPRGGAVQPLSLARGLARAAKQRGAQIFSRSQVISLNSTSKGWALKTPEAGLRAHWVILATNAYTDKLYPGLAKSIMPLVPIQIATEPLEQSQIGSILPQGHTISDSRRIIMYARREPGGQMVYGGLGKLGSDGKPRGFDWLIKDAIRVFPSLSGVKWQYRWGGQIALTHDHLPHLHEPEKGLLAGLGYNGRGVAMANVMGRVLAERVLGANPEKLPLPVTDINRYPFRTVQMMGKQSAIAWMRFLDAIEIRMR